MHGFELTKQGSIYRVSRATQQRSQLELNVTEGDLPADADSPSDVRLTLLAKNAQAGEVTNLLSEKLGASIVLDGPVQGTITANLQDVSTEEALQGIFSSSQFLLRKRGAVYHLANRSQQKRGQQMLFFSEGKVPFRYLHASDAESLEQKLFLMLPVTIPRESITVLPGQNAVTVVGTPETVDAILSYLELIDVPTSQVMIEVVLVEVRQGDTEALGLSLLGESGRLALESSTGIGLHFETLAKVPDAFQASLEALVSRNRARVLASPRVAVLHGEQATIRVGMENLFETVTKVYRGEEVAVGGVTRQSFNSIQTGITLTLRPWIGSEGDITLQIQPEVRDGSSISREASTIVERSVDTQVRVSDGGMVVIGGLLQEREERTESGIPILSRVPLLGGLFRDSSTQSHQTELLVLIRPQMSDSHR